MGAFFCKKCQQAYPVYEKGNHKNCSGPRRATKAVTATTTVAQTNTASVAGNSVKFVPALPPDDEPIVMGRARPPLVSGEPCYACGKSMAKSGAQRSREWRARKLQEAQ